MTKWRTYEETHDRMIVPGRLWILPQLYSPQLDNHRDVVAYLPPSYGEEGRRYPVIYMQDGQNLFDPESSFVGHWGLAETMDALAAEGLEAIVVGGANTGTRRIYEYAPFRDGSYGGGGGERYLSFLADTVRPAVNAAFPTRRERRYTAIAGSSMGGLISLYAFFHYRQVFGLCGAMSPSLWFAREAIFNALTPHTYVPGRTYLDVGSREVARRRTRVGRHWASQRYAAQVRKMERLLRKKGYRPGEELLFVHEEGGVHHESAWGRRFPAMARFLLQEALD